MFSLFGTDNVKDEGIYMTCEISSMNSVAPSDRKTAENEIEEQFETALRLYFQIRLKRDHLDKVHWINNLRSALKNAVSANKAPLNRGFWIDRFKASRMLDKVSDDSEMLARDFLLLENSSQTPDYGLEDLFVTCDLDLPPEWS